MDEHLSSGASPQTLKHWLPAPGQVFQNEALVSDHSMFIIGEKTGFAQNNATNPSSYGLPMDGKSILVRASGEGSGGNDPPRTRALSRFSGGPEPR